MDSWQINIYIYIQRRVQVFLLLLLWDRFNQQSRVWGMLAALDMCRTNGPKFTARGPGSSIVKVSPHPAG